MTAVDEIRKPIPVKFHKSPIAKLLKKYSKISNDTRQTVNLFIEKVLHNLSMEEFNELLKWSGWEEKRITETVRYLWYVGNREYVDISLIAICNAVLLKQLLQFNFPNCKIEYNKNCTAPETTWNPVISWLTINGQVASESS